MELIDFLTARLAEDEENARAATQGDWVWSREYVTPPGYDNRTIGALEPGDAAHIARHNPARVLDEVHAKRQIVEDIVRNEYFELDDTDGLAGRTMRYLAQPYAGHEDYREEWRPQ